MDTRRLVVKYLKRFVRQGTAVALIVVDVIVFSLALFADLSLPQWVYWGILMASVIWASFHIYAEQEREKEKQRRYSEERLNALRRQLQEIEGHRPKVNLFFQANEGLVSHLTVTLPPYPATPDIERAIEKARSEPAHRPPKVAGFGLERFMFQPTSEQLERYNERVDRYIAELAEFLDRKYEYDAFACRVRAIRFAVNNDGRRPAHDVVLFVHFPDELRVVPERDISAAPEAPQKPKEPRGILDAFEGLRIGPVLPSSGFLDGVDLPPIGGNVSGPYISEGDSTKVSYEIKTVMHNVPEADLDPLYVIFPAERKDRSFEIPYEIHAAELPDPVKGRLTIEVRYQIQPGAVD